MSRGISGIRFRAAFGGSMFYTTATERRYSRLGSLQGVLRLAIPVIVGRVGMYFMEIVDTLVVGQAGATALAGVGTGGALFWFVSVTASATLLPLDAMLSRKIAAGHDTDANNLLLHGLGTGLVLSALGMLILTGASQILPQIGVADEIVPPARDYLENILLSFPLVVSVTLMNSFWQARKKPVAMAVIVLLANIFNYFADMGLVLGHYGLPALGAKGAALATFGCRIFMAVSILIYSSRQFGGQLVTTFKSSWRPQKEMLRHIFKLGLPSATHAAAEVGAFSLTTIAVTRLGAEATAAHQVLLRIATFTFMFPLGISQATSVMVGHNMGTGDTSGARMAGWSGIWLGAAVMAISCVSMLAFPETIYGSFTNDPLVFQIGLSCLICVGLFQIFDGVQVAATGALRGIGNTAASMQANLLGYYILGIPLGLWLCFSRGMNILGLWIGLSAGLIVVAIWLLGVWMKLSRKNLAVKNPV